MPNDIASEKAAYWEGYYSRHNQENFYSPSQFAVFVAQELPERKFVVDVGCGSGRDTLYFAHVGNYTLGIDGSDSAISLCKDKKLNLNSSADFRCISVNDPKLANIVKKENIDNLPIVIYARFFLHAITDEEENNFFSFAGELCRNNGMLALEFRTIRDSSLQKVTASHYRRFLEPLSVIKKVTDYGFLTNYYVEGFGFAKYKTDDAYVARYIATKN